MQLNLKTLLTGWRALTDRIVIPSSTITLLLNSGSHYCSRGTSWRRVMARHCLCRELTRVLSNLEFWSSLTRDPVPQDGQTEEFVCDCTVLLKAVPSYHQQPRTGWPYFMVFYAIMAVHCWPWSECRYSDTHNTNFFLLFLLCWFLTLWRLATASVESIHSLV